MSRLWICCAHHKKAATHRAKDAGWKPALRNQARPGCPFEAQLKEKQIPRHSSAQEMRANFLGMTESGDAVGSSARRKHWAGGLARDDSSFSREGSRKKPQVSRLCEAAKAHP